MNKKIILWTIIFILTLQLVLALGIRPAKTELRSEETTQYSGTFWIVNNEKREFTIKLSIEGEMSKYVQLKNKEKELTFREDDDAKGVEFEITLPAQKDIPPGTSTANIIIEESLGSTSPNSVSTKLILKYKIIILGPYPDKYIETKLNFHEKGEDVEIVSEVQNLGKKDLEKVQTKFYVNDKKQQENVLETETTPLKTQENKLLTARLKRNVLENGEFEVLAITSYDNQKVELSKKLILGQPAIDITYFDKYFIANKINQYSLDLLNKWNKKIENVYVDVEVKKDNQKIDSFRTKSVDIEALLTKRINDYFDARNKNPGKYSFEMVVNFWNLYRMEQKTFQSEIITEEEYQAVGGANAVETALAGKATNTAEQTAKSQISGTTVGIILGIIALLSIIIYLFWRFKMREEE